MIAMFFMCKEHEQANIYDATTLKELVALTIDIIVHVEVKKKYDDESNLIGKERFISEIKFDPVSKLKLNLEMQKSLSGIGHE